MFVSVTKHPNKKKLNQNNKQQMKTIRSLEARFKTNKKRLNRQTFMCTMLKTVLIWIQ